VGPPRRYTIEPGRRLVDVWPLRDGAGPAYDLQVHGPNGFLRAYRGARRLRDVAVSTRDDAAGRLGWSVEGSAGAGLSLHDGYGRRSPRALDPDGRVAWQDDLSAQHHWYDFTLRSAADPLFLRRAAGRIETGRDGVSDIGLAGPATRRGS
jgi:phospholipase C